MRRLLLFTVLLAGAAGASAQEFVCLEHGVDFMDYHVRVKASSRGASVLTVYWNYSDSCNYRSASVLVPSSIDADKTGGALLKCTVTDCRACEQSVAGEYSCSVSYVPGNAEVSVVLKYACGSAALEIGSRGAELSVPVDFDALAGGCIGAEVSGRGEIVRNTLLSRYRTKPEESRFADVAALEAYLSQSNDSREGMWEYMDREFKGAGLSYEPGLLATVSDGAGGYLIVSVDEGISPLPEKGSMKSTVFGDNYDLRWFTADGRVIERESNATFELDGYVLRLSFPLEGATLRFRRRVQSR